MCRSGGRRSGRSGSSPWRSSRSAGDTSTIRRRASTSASGPGSGCTPRWLRCRREAQPCRSASLACMPPTSMRSRRAERSIRASGDGSARWSATGRTSSSPGARAPARRRCCRPCCRRSRPRSASSPSKTSRSCGPGIRTMSLWRPGRPTSKAPVRSIWRGWCGSPCACGPTASWWANAEEWRCGSCSPRSTPGTTAAPALCTPAVWPTSPRGWRPWERSPAWTR